LRDKLLALVASEGEKKDAEPSLVFSELSKLGINPQAAKDLVGFEIGVHVFFGYLFGVLFLVGGLAMLPSGGLFGVMFAAGAVYLLAYTHKLARLKKSS
jgi:hypothetical protein